MLQDGQEILEGRFQIVKKLGSGAFGEIYKGKHTVPNTFMEQHGMLAAPFEMASPTGRRRNDRTER